MMPVPLRLTGGCFSLNRRARTQVIGNCALLSLRCLRITAGAFVGTSVTLCGWISLLPRCFGDKRVLCLLSGPARGEILKGLRAHS